MPRPCSNPWCRSCAAPLECPVPLTIPAFLERWPWIGPDLQTLRDTLRPVRLPPDQGRPLQLPLPSGEHLLAMADPARDGAEPLGLAVLVHGLGGDSTRLGVRRLALLLQQVGFAVWRLNLRGAGAGRPLARGTYAGACSADLIPVLEQARRQAEGQPLVAAQCSARATGRARCPGLCQQSARSGGQCPSDRESPQPSLRPLVVAPSAGPDPGRSLWVASRGAPAAGGSTTAAQHPRLRCRGDGPPLGVRRRGSLLRSRQPVVAPARGWPGGLLPGALAPHPVGPCPR